MGREELFTRWWQTEDPEDEPITDASAAEDSVIEDLILRGQGVFKELTDTLVKLSAERTIKNEKLSNYNEAAIIALSYINDGLYSEAKKVLEKVVSL